MVRFVECNLLFTTVVNEVYVEYSGNVHFTTFYCERKPALLISSISNKNV
jgi:hypothetical protein